MASNTNNLGLLKKDPVADGNDTFNVRTMLNENWDKIDEFAGKTTPISRGGTGATTAAQALANLGGIAAGAVGNLHVWERVLNTDIPAHISETELSNVEVFYATAGSVNPTHSSYSITYSVSDSVSVDDAGNISLVNPTTVDCYIPDSSYSTFVKESSLKGKYVKVVKPNHSYVYNRVLVDGVWKIPSDATFSVSNPKSYTGKVTVSKAYRCVGVGITKSGIADYLTSTDPNAYPKQSAEGGQDAYYTLGDVDTSGYYLGPTYLYRSVPASTSLSVSEDGTVELNNPTNIDIDEVTIDSVQVLAGKFIRWPMYADGQIVFIPTDAQAVGVDSSNIKFNKYQPVIGYPAIPANTTITYLGQLGGGARIEVGSYVGTGVAASASSPHSITFPFAPKLVSNLSGLDEHPIPTAKLKSSEYISVYNWSVESGKPAKMKISTDGKTIYWYSTYSGAQHEMNTSGTTYYYYGIG